jgi:prepilin signal peptidase PulO-like enzyme (type II secretory pathway)
MLGALITSALGALSDQTSGKLANGLTLPSILLGLVASFWPGGTTPGEATKGALICVLPSLSLYFATKGKAIGGGDVKLLGALGVWLGAPKGLEAQLTGLVVCAAYLLMKNVGRPLHAIRTVPVRLGPFLFLGVVAVALGGLR